MIETVLNFISFVKLLLRAVPELKLIYDEHINDYDDLLEHVFMGDVTRFAEQLYMGDSKSECLVRLLNFLDEAYAAEDEKLKELVSVSFLENLSRNEPCYEGIRMLLSEQLKEELLNYD